MDFVRVGHVKVWGRQRRIVTPPEPRRHVGLAPRSGILPADDSTMVDYPYMWAGIYQRRLLEAGLLDCHDRLHTAEDRPWIWRLHRTAESYLIADVCGLFYRRGVTTALTSVGDARQLHYLDAFDLVFSERSRRTRRRSPASQGDPLVLCHRRPPPRARRTARARRAARPSCTGRGSTRSSSRRRARGGAGSARELASPAPARGPADRGGAGVTQLFVASTLFGAITLGAAIDGGHFDSGQTQDVERVLVVSANAATPETTCALDEEPAFAALRHHFDRIVDWNAAIAPYHPSVWSTRPADHVLWKRYLREHWQLRSPVTELVVESVAVPPARTLCEIFDGSALTVYADGLMSYGPTRNRLDRQLAGRITRLLHPDLVPGVAPLLLAEFGVPRVVIDDAMMRHEFSLRREIDAALRRPCRRRRQRRRESVGPAMILGSTWRRSGSSPKPRRRSSTPACCGPSPRAVITRWCSNRTRWRRPGWRPGWPPRPHGRA